MHISHPIEDTHFSKYFLNSIPAHDFVLFNNLDIHRYKIDSQELLLNIFYDKVKS